MADHVIACDQVLEVTQNSATAVEEIQVEEIRLREERSCGCLCSYDT